MKASSLGILISLLVLVTTSPVVMVWGWETDQVDQCLDGGGSFDYETKACDFSTRHEFVPFAARHPRLVALTKAGWLLAVLLVIAVGIGGRLHSLGRADGR